jgi:dihydroorotate dehydrogenase (fumarate)
MNLQTIVAGIKFNNPLLNASGCRCTTKEQLDILVASQSGGIVTKSATYYAKQGNPKPSQYIVMGESINSIGLENPGVVFYSKYYTETLIPKPFIYSIWPKNGYNAYWMIENCISPQISTIIEINISCPNVVRSEKNIWAMYKDIICGAKYGVNNIKKIYKSKLVWGVKLPPLFYPEDFKKMAKIILNYKPDFITTTNTIPNGLMLDPVKGETLIAPNGGFGGIGGKAIKAIGLANVRQFYELFRKVNVKIDIIGCGGISSATDVLEYIMCGANAVQIGTHFLEYGPKIFAEIEEELRTLLNKRQETIQNLVGKLRIRSSL